MKIDNIKKGRIIQMIEDGYSQRQVAIKLNVSRCGIQKIIKNWQNPTQKTVKRGGKKKLISQRTARKIARKVNLGKILTPRQAKLELATETGIRVSESTVRRSLKEQGLKSYVKKKKPSLTQAQKLKRLKFCNEVKNFGVNEWRNVLFSDETSVQVCGPAASRYTWKKSGALDQAHNIRPTSKFGGGRVTIWGCFGFLGVGHAVVINGKLNAATYLDVINEEMLASPRLCVPDPANFTFQQDNDPTHKAKIVMENFKEKNVKLFEWPPNSPDLNPIENLWYIIKQKISRQGVGFKKAELWEKFHKEWKAMDVKICQNLVDSMPKRIKMCLQAGGNPIKY